MRNIVRALLAASMLVPVAAQAQEVDPNAGQSRRSELRQIREQARAERGEQAERGQADRGQADRGQADRGPRGGDRGERQVQRRDDGPAQPRPDRQRAFTDRQDRQDRGGWNGVRPDPQPPIAQRQDRDDGDRGQRADRAKREDRSNQWRQNDAGPGTPRADRQDGRPDQRDDWRNGRRPDVAQNGRQWDRTDRDWRNADRRDDRVARSGFDERRGANGFDNRRGNGFDDDRRGSRFDSNRAWNRGWRSDNRYDYDRYRAINRRAFSLPRYYAPSGWNYGYRRFSIGASLSSSLWGQNYWIDDPWAYRLPDAYGPYRWVRYYDDALLIDLRTGRVVDVVNDIFY